jgi:hypothetical protein
VYNGAGGRLSEAAKGRIYKEKGGIAPKGNYLDTIYCSNVFIDDSSSKCSSATFVGLFETQ